MHKFFPCVAALSMLACSSDTTVPDEPRERGWADVAAGPWSPSGQRHDDVFFLGDNGWIVNTRGEVHRSSDGGQSWTLAATRPDVYFRAVGFATPTLGWAGNLNGYRNPTPESALYETRDGGATWQNITARITGPRPVGICGIHVLDSQHIYAVGRWHGPAIFVRSVDGGVTWTARDLRPLATGLVDVFFFDAQNGFAVGGDGVGDTEAEQRVSRTVVLRTRDGGDTWTRVYASEPNATWGWKIHFASRTTGYVAIDGFADGHILKTTDGGATWAPLKVPPAGRSGFQGIGFVTPDSGWAAPPGPSVYETTDGGATWTTVYWGNAVNRIRILPSGDGFAVGTGLYRFTR